MTDTSEFTFNELIDEIVLRSTYVENKILYRRLKEILHKVVDHLDFNSYNSDKSRADVEHVTDKELNNLVKVFDEEIKEYMQKGYFLDHLEDISEYTYNDEERIKEIETLTDMFGHLDIYQEVYWRIEDDISNNLFETLEELEQEYQYIYIYELIQTILSKEKAINEAKKLAEKYEIEPY